MAPSYKKKITFLVPFIQANKQALFTYLYLSKRKHRRKKKKLV